MSHIIGLTRGKKTIVDADIDDKILKKKFCTTLCGGKFYAVTNENGKNIYLHRLIMNPRQGMIVDHINGDTLDNRKENLRVCTHSENIRNQKLHPDKLQKYRGVDFVKCRKKFRARITVDHKEKHLGLYETAEEAFKVYQEASKNLFGKFSNV